MNNKKVIITADDYGMCSYVDDAIVECVNKGTITSFNVIFNMAEDVKKPELTNNASIGMHWCITAGKPVTDPKQIPTLVDENGIFYPIKEFKKRFANGLIKEKDIVLELKNQYEKFCGIFGKPAYWNTHQNSAILSLKTFDIFSKTAKELGIPATRNFQRVYIDIHLLGLKSRVLEVGKSMFANFFFGKIVRKDFAMPSGRLFTINVTSKLDIDRLIKVINNCKYDTVEVVVHPATALDCDYFGTIREPRLEEYNFLKDATIIDKFKQNGIELVDFEYAKKIR